MRHTDDYLHPSILTTAGIEGEAEKYECTAWWGLGKISVFITQ